MESNESSDRSDTDDVDSASESDMSNSSDSSGSATSDSESSESASSEEDFLTTAEPETSDSITVIPPTPHGDVTCFTVHPETEPRGDNFKQL